MGRGRQIVKVLILSCNTGGGHNSAAASIKECFEGHGYKCDVFNTLDLFSKGVSKVISRGHVFVYRYLPKLFGAGYRFEEKHGNKILYTANASTADELYKYIKEYKYDAVIAVHVFAELTLTEIRRKYAPDIKMYFVATDYTCSPGVNMGDMDGYFIPVGLKGEFVRCGVPEERITESGIPVRAVFYNRADKGEAKRNEGLSEGGKNILFMSGSMGAGPMEEIAELLAEKMPEGVTLTVVCGSNKKLYDELLPLAGDSIRIYGFVEHIASLMDASDVMISKPGGLSTTEALTKHLPLICLNSVPGCETRNLEFLLKKGYIFHAENVEELVLAAVRLVSDRMWLSEITERLSGAFNYRAADRIYTRVYEDYEKNVTD